MKTYPFVFRKYCLRLKSHDYSRKASYFITIDCYRKECRFGHIEKKRMIANEFGKIVENDWIELPKKFTNVELGIYQIMPNHFHAIMHITRQKFRWRKDKSLAKITLSEIIGEYKSIVYKKCLELHCLKSSHLTHIPLLGKIWKRSFFDAIIRDNASLKSISRYIRNNPRKWLHQKP